MNEHPWSAVETHPQCEELAALALLALGYEPWLPRYQKLLKGRRVENGRRIHSRQDGLSEPRPLFPRYLFLPLPTEDAGYAVDKANGVRRLIRHPHTEEGWGKPKRIRARIIIQLQEAVERGVWENHDGKLCFGSPKLHVAEGDTVRTPGGIVGVILSLDAQGRYELLTEMLGGQRRVRGIEAYALELVAGG